MDWKDAERKVVEINERLTGRPTLPDELGEIRRCLANDRGLGWTPEMHVGNALDGARDGVDEDDAEVNAWFDAQGETLQATRSDQAACRRLLGEVA